MTRDRRRSPARFLCAVALAVALVGAGCSDDGDGDKDKGAAASTTSTTAPSTTASTGPSTTAPSTATTATGSAAPGDTGQPAYSFRTPSENIFCYLTADEARCDILEYTYTPPEKPADCDLDWGMAVAIGGRRGNPFFVCAGDTVHDDAAPVLPYGSSVTRGDVTCRSEQRAVICSHRPSGHRFELSRSQWTFG